MTGFEPVSSGIGSNRSANCATTTALFLLLFIAPKRQKVVYCGRSMMVMTSWSDVIMLLLCSFLPTLLPICITVLLNGRSEEVFLLIWMALWMHAQGNRPIMELFSRRK